MIISSGGDRLNRIMSLRNPTAIATADRNAISLRLAGSKERGFTLIETICSIVIISVAVIGLFAIVTNCVVSNNTPQPFEIAVGTQYVQEKLERIYAEKRSHGMAFTDINTSRYPDEPLGNGYTRTTKVDAWPWDADVNYKRISVQVSHNGTHVADGVLLVAN